MFSFVGVVIWGEFFGVLCYLWGKVDFYWIKLKKVKISEFFYNLFSNFLKFSLLLSIFSHFSLNSLSLSQIDLSLSFKIFSILIYHNFYGSWRRLFLQKSFINATISRLFQISPSNYLHKPVMHSLKLSSLNLTFCHRH